MSRSLPISGILLLLLFLGLRAEAQNDSTGRADTARKIPVDSITAVAAPISHMSEIDSVLRYHSPRKAAIRSAILPGLGQIYNRKYWKLPIVYGALGVSGYVFVYNLKSYRELRDAYRGRTAAAGRPDPVGGGILYDSTGYFKIKDPILRRIDVNALISYRNEYRRNIDYSALVFILLWGLNVVDATVDAHLKTFDISPDLSFHLKFGPSQMAGTSGVSLVLAFK